MKKYLVLSLLLILFSNINFSQLVDSRPGIDFEENQIELSSNQKMFLDTLNMYLSSKDVVIDDIEVRFNCYYTENEYKKDKYIGVKRCFEVSKYLVDTYKLKSSLFVTEVLDENYPNFHKYPRVVVQINSK